MDLDEHLLNNYCFSVRLTSRIQEGLRGCVKLSNRSVTKRLGVQASSLCARYYNWQCRLKANNFERIVEHLVVQLVEYSCLVVSSHDHR